MSERRRFGATERGVLYLAGGGRCAQCGRELEPGWHGDHVTPYARGGVTDVINGQALCPGCNLEKGVRMPNELRVWQREALRRYGQANATDFLVCATPGSGKTFLALTLARRLLDERTVQRVVVVVPTDALREQWADEAGRAGIDLMPVHAPEDYHKTGYHGCVVTYAQLAVGAGADLLRSTTRTPTVALLDEIHHAGDNRSWGNGVRHALEHATRRIGLTGTPWRKDRYSPIPFVAYGPDGKVAVDSSYEYGEAVADGVCRRIEFHTYDGEARWVDCGKVVTAEMSAELSDDDEGAVLNTVLHPERDWMPAVLDAAVQALDELRREVPDAGGLVIADRQDHAREYAAMLQAKTGSPVTVAVSDDADACKQIEQFREGRTPWLVAVRMVSEGVDIKRLAVGVYATRSRTPLFFRQVVGRFVRSRLGEDINAKLLIPAVPTLMRHAKEVEDELRHQLDQERDGTAGEQPGEQVPLNFREPLSASEAMFAASIFAGREATAEEHAQAEQWCRDRGIPVMYAPNVLPDVMIAAQEPATPVVAAQPPQGGQRHRQERLLRGDIKTLVGKIAYAARLENREVNAELLRRFGPRGHASVDQLEETLAHAAAWLADLS